MMMVYGIPNCDTVKKARAWLAAQGVAHIFHDFKKQGVPVDRLPAWVSAVGRDKLLNRQSTSWRQLSVADQASAQTTEGAISLIVVNPSLIKRPVVEWATGALDSVTVGFNAHVWAETSAKLCLQCKKLNRREQLQSHLDPLS